MPDIAEELARERTETAHERTLLAVERTFSAWVRTGLGCVATGFAIVKLMSEGEPEWLVRGVGTLFVTVGALIFGVGFWTYRRAMKHVPVTPIRGAPGWVIGAISFVLFVGAATALASVFPPG